MKNPFAALKHLFNGGQQGDQAAAEVPMREAAGITVDADEDGWRRLTGDNNRDLSPLTQRRMQELAVYLWKTNPLANRLVELPLVYLLAEGVTLTAKDEEAQGWLDDMWGDPINRLDIKLSKYVREMALFGEQCWPVFVNEFTGHMRLGYLDPALIATVITDPDNATQPIGIITTKNKKGEARRYRVIINGPEDVFSKRTQEIRASFTDGDCFYYTVNDLCTAARGHSDLLAQLDWLDAYDQALFGEVERWNYLRAFIWDVTLKGATKEEVDRKAREIEIPNAGGVRVHNDAEEWQAITPDLQSVDGSSFARLFRNHIMGGGTLPEHWYGGGGDVNRATAGEMGEPTFKVFSFRQRTWKHIIEEVGAYQIRCRARAAGVETMADEPEFRPVAQFPELTARDTTKYASALQQVIAGAILAIDRNLLSEASAVALIALVAAQLGLEVDPATELEAVRADAARRAEQDVFPDLEDEDGAGEERAA